MDEAPKIEILWGEAPVVLTRDKVFAAKYAEGLPLLTPGTVVLLPGDAVLVKLSPPAPVSEDPDDNIISMG